MQCTVDEALVAEARDVLGTKTAEETVAESLRRVVDQPTKKLKRPDLTRLTQLIAETNMAHSAEELAAQRREETRRRERPGGPD